MAPPDAQALPEIMSSSEATKNSRRTVPTPDDVNMACLPAMVYTYTINHADGTSNFPYVSEYCETMFGFTADHLMSHPELLMNAVHEDDSEKFTKVRLRIISARKLHCGASRCFYKEIGYSIELYDSLVIPL